MGFPSSGFGGSKDSSFSWARLPYLPFYQGSPLATPSLLMGQVPRVYGGCGQVAYLQCNQLHLLWNGGS